LPRVNGTGATVARLFVSAFLAVLFLQSGLDKVLDRKGNVDHFRSVFERSFLRRFSKALLTLITLGEISAGVLSAAGCLTLLATRERAMAFAGAALASACVISVFLGLRLVRDYPAAARVVPYFISCLAALVLLG
jgi:uncharacterized membrane protein YphA (DoxX/SURF4 family)